MEKYLHKLHQINQKIKDPSEFSIFITSAKLFLKSNTDHVIYVRPVKKALNRIKNTQILAVILEIAASLRISKSFINTNRLKRHLKHSATRDAAINYLIANNITDLDSEIIKLISNNAYPATKSICEYLKQNNNLLKDYLCIEDPKHAFRQLEFISKCNVFYNIFHYIQYLGSNSKLISHKAFEAFLSFFKSIEFYILKNELDKFITKFKIDNVININEDNRVSLNINHKSLNILDGSNFIEFGWYFLQERDQLINCFKNKETINSTVSDILQKYSYNELTVDYNNLHKRGLFEEIHNNHIEIENDEIFIFDHLFSDSYRKDTCGCYEG